MILKNPDAPATTKQLFKLHQLTDEDTREWKLTVKQASDKIEEIEMKELEANRPPIEFNGRMPFDEAKVVIIEGEQGSGKSNTGVGRVVDSYRKDCALIYCQDVLGIICEIKGYDRKNRVAKIKYNGQIKLVRIPKSYELRSPMRIFCNFTLYGLPYVFCPSFRHILKWLKQGLILNGWLIIDEYYIGGNARESMSALGRELEKQSFQYRKMQLEVVIITPMARLIDWTARMIPTERISCSYNKKTRRIALTIKKKGVKGSREISYDATQYWGNYWTNERINA